jgi:hypothetical protein
VSAILHDRRTCLFNRGEIGINELIIGAGQKGNIMSKISINLNLHYPTFIEKTVVYFLLQHRKKKRGIAFRKINLAKGVHTLVDPEDYERLSKYDWQLNENVNKKCYAVRLAGFIVPMHREIMNAPAGMVVHHKDGNGLNNTKANLEIITVAENNRNCRKTSKQTSSKYKGVTFAKRKGKWQAVIGCNGTSKFLGYFENEDDAARAYDEAAKIYHGRYAVLNFPDKAGGLSGKQLELLRAECLS